MRRILCIALFLLFFQVVHFFQFSRPASAQTPDSAAAAVEIVRLEPGKPLARTIAGGERLDFELDLKPEEFARIVVSQRGIDLAARLLDADGKILSEFDADPRAHGEETIELAAKEAGAYRLTIEPRQKSARAGRFEILLAEVRAATEKDLALEDARRFISGANRLWRGGKYADALPLAERALAIREKELGPANEAVGQAIFTLANIYSDLPDYEKAEALFKKALAVREKSLGKDHISLSPIYNNLGVLYKDKGDYVSAETFYLRALEIREKELEPNHPLIAGSLNNLAGISLAKGDTEKAEAFYRRALEIREKAFGSEHPDVATSLNNLANIYTDPAKAEPLYVRALAIREKVLAADHPDIAQTLYNLALLYTKKSDFAKAEPICRRALAIYEKILGAEHPFVSYPLNLLGGIYKNTGDYANAEAMYLRTIALKEKTQGSLHPHLGGALANLANLYAVKGEIEKSLETQARANAIYEYNLALNLTTGSEREKLTYLKMLTEIENQTLTLNFQNAPDSAAAADLGATAVLQRKGRVLDAVSDSLSALRRRFNPQDRTLLDDLNETTTKLVGFVLNGRQDGADVDFQKQIKSLEQERERLESEISRRSAGFYEQSKPVTLKAVREAIPKNAALIEFAVYVPISRKNFEFGANDPPKPADAARYAVYVILPEGEVRAKDIGSVKEIDAKVDAFRRALRDPKRADFAALARAADEKIMQPVRRLAGGARHLLISPDGELNLIPFEALVDENGKFLIEDHEFSYLTSGRDLLRMQVARESKAAPLIVANPAFGEPLAESDARSISPQKQIVRNKNAAAESARRFSDAYFAPLGGTAEEARAIHALFPEAAVLNGAGATEAALKTAAAPRILHIATHGFFLEESEKERGRNPNASNSERKDEQIENPLMRAGLALAGANRRRGSGGGEEDGILTALEASGLNLWGTKLVVLSACGTGLGEVRSGEGVYGLRRAITLAGTESTVMSLWSVSDFVTRELMANYYKNLKQGMGRGAALRAVQREMMNRDGRRHPFYWASFIQSGEWANLDGRR